MQYRREAGLHQKTAFILLDILVLFFMQINFLALCISCLRNQIFSNLFAIFVNWPQSRNSRSAKHSSDPSSINCIQCWLNSVKKRFNFFRKIIEIEWVMKILENTLILWQFCNCIRTKGLTELLSHFQATVSDSHYSILLF